MPEVWKPVAGLENSYEVSDYGRVRSLDRKDGIGRSIRGVILRQQPHPKTGHMQVALCRGSRANATTAKVHQLVLAAFVGPRPGNLMGCHNDGNPANNHVDNLRWGTAQSNSADRYIHGTAFQEACARGHELRDPNQYMNDASRRCKACDRASRKARRAGNEATQDLADAEYQRLLQEPEPRMHCANGHLLEENNVYRRGNYWRCRACHNLRRKKSANA